MLGHIKQIFIVLFCLCRSLDSIVNISGHTKCISLNNQQCITQPTLINLHPNEYIQGLPYYPLAINLDKCVESFNTLNDLSSKVCVPDEIGRFKSECC